MKTLKYKGKKYRWNPEASPLYAPVKLLAEGLILYGVMCFILLCGAFPA